MVRAARSSGVSGYEGSAVVVLWVLPVVGVGVAEALREAAAMRVKALAG
jgi:hypothetical protein